MAEDTLTTRCSELSSRLKVAESQLATWPTRSSRLLEASTTSKPLSQPQLELVSVEDGLG